MTDESDPLSVCCRHLANSQHIIEAKDAEIASLREAIRRLADQDAMLSVCDGNVTVTMDATLTDAEREAVAWAARFAQSQRDSRDMAADYAVTLRGLLERTKGGEQ